MARQHLAEHPFCVCGCDRLAEVVDHIRPHRGDVALAFDADNLQSMTRACHGRKTRLETAGGGLSLSEARTPPSAGHNERRPCGE
jgi:5-methylcytosine-specific restriction endonuclease McrA